MVYVLIKDNVVQNIIIADEKFVPLISDEYDLAEAFDPKDWYPSPGDSYDPSTKKFNVPVIK